MQRDHHVERQVPQPYIGVGPERKGTTLQEREDGNGVAGVEAAHELTIAGGNGRHHELQARRFAQRGGRGERAVESLEHRFSRVAHPVLVVQIVNGHELGLTRLVHHSPVMAAAALRHVLHRAGTHPPTLGQRLPQPLRRQVNRRASHASAT